MRFGNREVMELVFKDIKTRKPVFYFETLKMSEVDQKSAEVKLRAGMANPTRIIWNGSKDVILNCEDGLISPETFALFTGTHPEKGIKVVHEKEAIEIKQLSSGITDAPTGAKYVVELAKGKRGAIIDNKHPFFVFKSEQDGASIINEITKSETADTVSKGKYKFVNYTPEVTGSSASPAVPARLFLSGDDFEEGDVVIIDYYVEKPVTELIITSKDFPGTFLIEGWTLFRKEETGRDHVCKVTIPKAKLGSDFQISMKSDGDPGVYKFSLTVLAPLRGSEMIRFDIEDDEYNGSLYD